MLSLLQTQLLKSWPKVVDARRDKHQLKYLFWECTLRCNFFCKHCGSNARSKLFDNELTTEEIKKSFKTIAEDFDASKIMIGVTGGEPLLREDLFEVMSYANNLGFKWGLVTNGYFINQNTVGLLKQSGACSIVVSIDGLEEVHDEFRGIKGSFNKAANAIRLLAEANFTDILQITSTIHQKNIFQLEEMYQLFVKSGINSWRLLNVDPIGRAEKNTELLLENEQLKQLLQFVKEKRKISLIEIEYECSGFLGPDFEGKVRNELFMCYTGINIGSILANGDIFVCPNVPRLPQIIQGNVKKDRFSKIWNEKFELFRKKDRTNNDSCLKCHYWEQCLGNSFHLWDFNRQKTKLCHWNKIKND